MADHLMEASETQASTIELDIAKHVFQAHGADAAGHVVFRKRLTRARQAICEAAQRPTMRFVPVKSEEQQASGVVFRARGGAISTRGERTIRRLLILGASAVIGQACIRGAPEGSWLGQMLPRRPKMLVAVALANKTARIVRALLVEGGEYRAPVPAM